MERHGKRGTGGGATASGGPAGAQVSGKTLWKGRLERPPGAKPGTVDVFLQALGSADSC